MFYKIIDVRYYLTINFNNVDLNQEIQVIKANLETNRKENGRIKLFFIPFLILSSSMIDVVYECCDKHYVK